MLAGWADVAPTLHLRLPPEDPVRLLAPFVHPRVHSEDPFMLRVLDAPAAVAARGWPVAVAGRVDLHLDDDVCPWNAGPHRLTVDDGTGHLGPGGTGATRLSPRGLALLYAGAADPQTIRAAGLMAGGDDRSDAFLRAATAGPAPAMLDYF
jgi:predicted acetyltransferase